MSYPEGSTPRDRPPPPCGAVSPWRRPDRLDRARHVVDRLLDAWPEDTGAARGRVAAQLWAEPSAEELLLIARAAVEQEPGAARELTRDALALRSQAERTLLSYWGLTRLDPTVVEVLAQDIETLAASARALERALAGVGAVGSDDVASVRAVLGPAVKKMIAARAQLPMLLHVSVCTATGEPPSRGALTEDEAALLSRYAHGSPEMPGPYDRECLEACCLRLILEEHVMGLGRAGRSAVPTARMAPVDLSFYSQVGQGLRRLEDGARAAGRPEEAARLGRFRESLLATYQKLAGAEERAFRPAPRRTPARPDRGNARRERRAPARKRASERPRPARARRVRRARRRPRAHILVLAPLAVVFTVAFWLIPGGPPPRIETRLEDYTGTVPLVSVAPVGTMLHAEVIPSWPASSPEVRRGQLEALATVAVAQGFRVVRLVDRAGVGVAEWTATGGARLTEISGAPGM